MNARIVTDGRDPLTEPALDLLTSWGVPSNMIKRIVVDSRVGDAQILQVTLMVPAEPIEPVVGCPEHGQPMIRGLDGWLCACSYAARDATVQFPRATLDGP